MAGKTLIFGKETWPHTIAAREAFKKQGREIEYFNVTADADKMKTMLTYSEGIRKVPVIVDHDDVTVGFDGGTWRV